MVELFRVGNQQIEFREILNREDICVISNCETLFRGTLAELCEILYTVKMAKEPTNAPE